MVEVGTAAVGHELIQHLLRRNGVSKLNIEPEAAAYSLIIRKSLLAKELCSLLVVIGILYIIFLRS